jgi:uncharacterized protein (DUF433 family)
VYTKGTNKVKPERRNTMEIKVYKRDGEVIEELANNYDVETEDIIRAFMKAVRAGDIDIDMYL